MQVLKSWTGGDPITARFLFGEDFTFKPVGKIWLAANTKPLISERNYAAWRRVHLIPFNVTIPKPEQDKELESKLLEELPGILNWALEGLKEYQRIGLEPPEAVKAATEAYRKENDSLEAFVSECCDVRTLAICKNSDLIMAYRNYCGMSGYEALSQKKFSEDLSIKPGVRSKRDMHGMVWIGIDLKPDWKLCRIGDENNRAQKADSMMDMKDMKANAQSFLNSASRGNLAQNPTYHTYPAQNKALDSDFMELNPTYPGEDDGPKMSKRDMPTPGRDSEDPGFEKFKAEMKKRHCLMCRRNFSYDLAIHYLDGYICQACQSGHGPAPVNERSTLA
jgi:putative DNA primase/helicase